MGTGPGLLPLELVLRSRELKVVGLDPSHGMITLARHLCGKIAEDRLRFIVGGVYHLPFPSSSFDMVVSVGVLHHLQDLPKALGEIERVLRPGGEAWLYEVIMDTEWDEVRKVFREMEIPIFPTLPFFLFHRALSRMRVGRRLVGMRREDLSALRNVLKGLGPKWKMEVRKPFLKVVFRKDGK